jgi:hypothetical protein
MKISRLKECIKALEEHGIDQIESLGPDAGSEQWEHLKGPEFEFDVPAEQNKMGKASLVVSKKHQIVLTGTVLDKKEKSQ